jgi:hypothetical protein
MRAMGFPTGTTNMSGISELQQWYLLGQARDLNFLTWVVSLVVAEQKRLASSLTRHMKFYELRSTMEPPHFVKTTSKVIGGKWASTAHPWNMWRIGRFFAKNKDEEFHGKLECHSQSSNLVQSKMDFKKYVEKMFFEEHIAHQMEEIWKLS